MRNVYLPLAIFFGFVIGCYILGHSIVQFKTLNRVISVKGLSEREVEADLAVWSLKFAASSDDQQQAFVDLEQELAKTKEFLMQHGITNEEITRGHTEVFDKLNQRYIDNNNSALRYRISTELLIRSNNIAAIAASSAEISELLKQGVVFDNDGYSYSGPQYIFTKLNDIKPEMVAEATARARESAEEFARNSQSNIGELKNARQGQFEFYSNENREEQQSIFKTVRAVISAEYYLE